MTIMFGGGGHLNERSWGEDEFGVPQTLELDQIHSAGYFGGPFEVSSREKSWGGEQTSR